MILEAGFVDVLLVPVGKTPFQTTKLWKMVGTLEQKIL